MNTITENGKWYNYDNKLIEYESSHLTAIYIFWLHNFST